MSYYLQHPLVIYNINPRTKVIIEIFCVVGLVPQNIKSAILNYSTIKQEKPKELDRLDEMLKEYFGSQYKNTLLLSSVPTYEKLFMDGQTKFGGDELESQNRDELESQNRDELESQNRDELESQNRDEGEGIVEDSEDAETDLFAKLLNEEEAPTVKTKKIKTADIQYVFRSFNTFDRMYEVREKVAIVTEIPIYRQHLFRIQNGIVENLYSLNTDIIYDTSILDIENKDILYGIPIDRNLLNYKTDYRIESYDYSTPFNYTDAIYLVDIDNLIQNAIVNFNSISNNLFEFEMIYYGFILKYYPQMLPEVFKLYLRSEFDIIEASYPSLIGYDEETVNKYKKQDAILCQMCVKNSQIEKIDLSYSINNSIIKHNIGFQINIRNLFDLYSINSRIPMVYLYDSVDNENYLIQKKGIFDNITKKLNKFPNSVNFVVNLANYDIDLTELRMIVEDRVESMIIVSVDLGGILRCELIWDSDDGIDFNHNEWIIFNIVNPLLIEIGELIGKTGNQKTEKRLRPINVVEYDKLNISIVWRNVVSSEGFKLFKSILENFIEADIINVKQSNMIGITEYLFKKGMYRYNEDNLNSRQVINQYAYLTDSSILSLWQHTFQGKIMYIFHKITNIKYEVFNMTRDEFTVMLRFLKYIIYLFKSQYVQTTGVDKHNRLKQLREIDPELYNIKKMGSEKTYSELCQSKYQPKMLEEHEYDGLKRSDKERAVEYWNFTREMPVYYFCDNPKTPYITFITGKHPKDYCLPCCKKMSSYKNESSSVVMNKCITDRMFSDDIEKSLSHILTYGKHIGVGRYGRIPPTIKQFLNHTADDLMIYGVEQIINHYEVGILFIISYILNLSYIEICKTTISILRKNPNIFYVFSSGNLPIYFANMDEFIESITRIFIENDVLYKTSFLLWNNLFIEIGYCFFKLIFVGIDDEQVYINIKSSKTLGVCACKDFKICFYYMLDKLIYPIIQIEEQKKNKSMIKSPDKININKSFCSNSPLVETTQGLFRWSNLKIKIPNLDMLRAYCEKNKYKILKYFIYINNLCYAILVQGIYTTPIYLPCDPEYVDVDPTEVDMNGYQSSLENKTIPNLTSMIQIINDLNKFSVKFGNFKFQAVCRFIKNGLKIVGIKTTDFMFYCYDDFDNIKKIETTQEIENINRIPISSCNNIIDVKYPLDDINAVINRFIKQKKKLIFTKDKVALYNLELYKNTLYQQLLYEFTDHIEKETNTELREKITEIIQSLTSKNIKEVEHKIHTIIDLNHSNESDLYNSDFVIIQNIIRKYLTHQKNIKLILQDFNNTRLAFDNILIKHLKTLKTIDEVKRELYTVMDELIIYDSINGDSIFHPNMIFTCKAKVGFCKETKIIITDKKLYDDFVSIMAGDIMSNRYELYLLPKVHTENYLNYFNFIKRDDETINISLIK